MAIASAGAFAISAAFPIGACVVKDTSVLPRILGQPRCGDRRDRCCRRDRPGRCRREARRRPGHGRSVPGLSHSYPRDSRGDCDLLRVWRAYQLEQLPPRIGVANLAPSLRFAGADRGSKGSIGVGSAGAITQNRQRCRNEPQRLNDQNDVDDSLQRMKQSDKPKHLQGPANK